MKKKGENLATHEDLDELVDQMATITRTTKSIEASISSDMWDRQKRWELKRDVLFEAAKRMAEIDDALSHVRSVLKIAGGPGAEREQYRIKAKQRWEKASIQFQETLVLVGVTGERETIEALEQFSTFGIGIFVELCKSGPEAYKKLKWDYLKSILKARAAIRKELGIDSAGTSQVQETPEIPNLSLRNSEDT
ncbi:MAG: hypothetical protein WBP85_04670 [Terracidiphilus sp.]